MAAATLIQEGNRTTIRRNDGKYSILYGTHIKSQPTDNLPEKVDVVVLETGTTAYLANPLRAVESLKSHIQYKTFIQHLETKRIPLIFADTKFRFNDYVLLLADNALAGIEWMHGMKLLQRKEGKNMPKIVQTMLGAWLIFPSFANMVRMASCYTGIGMRQSGALKKLSHKLHPEVDFLYLTLRNAIIAEKEIFFMKELGNNSTIATVLGAGHVGIEDMLTMDDTDRLNNLKSIMPAIRQLMLPEYFYKAIQYVYNGSTWEVDKVFTVPTLRSLV